MVGCDNECLPRLPVRENGVDNCRRQGHKLVRIVIEPTDQTDHKNHRLRCSFGLNSRKRHGIKLTLIAQNEYCEVLANAHDSRST